MENQSILTLCRDDSPLHLPVNRRQEFQDDNDIIMSDAQYAEELLFQEALMASIVNGKPTTSLDWDKDSSSEKNSSKEIIEPSPQKGSTEIGESSQFFCEICAESKEKDQIFQVQRCNHLFCTECIAKHISVKIQKSPAVSSQENGRWFTCPGLDCQGLLEIDKCMEIVPKDVIIMWGDLICESMISASQKFYCPYKDCSALLVNDGEEMIRESECPFCHRLFCAQCKVAWHCGVGCEEYLRLNESEKGREDLMVHALAKLKKWQRCPHCLFFVEKNEGCLHMTCRCGYEFCYGCGATWTPTHHNGCQGQFSSTPGML